MPQIVTWRVVPPSPPPHPMDGHAGTNINVALGVEDYGHAEIWNSYHAHEWKAMFFIGCLLQVRKYFLPQGNGLYQPYSNPWDSDVLLSKVWHIMTLFCSFQWQTIWSQSAQLEKELKQSDEVVKTVSLTVVCAGGLSVLSQKDNDLADKCIVSLTDESFSVWLT